MSAPAYRAAILGCGHIAEKHAEGYREAGIPLVAAADIVEANLNRLSDAFGIPGRYTDYRHLLAEVRPEIVSVCTWPPLHEPMVLAAVQAGARAVVCEKPLTTSLGSADRMLQACRQAGVLLVVGHQRRYEAHWQQGRRRVAEGAIGTVERLLVSQGGDLLSDGVHGINLALFLTGDSEVSWVMGQIDRSHFSPEAYAPPATTTGETGTYGRMPAAGWRYGHAVEDSAVVTFALASGPHVSLELGKIRRGKGYIEITVLGGQGILQIDTDGRWRLWGPAGLDERQFGPEYTAAPFAAEMRDVVRVLQGELSRHPLDATYHRQALEVAMATFESARRRRRIPLPLAVAESPLEAMVAAGEV